MNTLYLRFRPQVRSDPYGNGSGRSNLKHFWHSLLSFGGEKVRIARTGYTGEDGFEIYSSPKAAESLAKKVLAKGAAYGVKLCGLGARDSLRLEAGLPLYGHEISDSISPFEASLDWTVKLNKPDFIGKNALTEQRRVSRVALSILSSRVAALLAKGPLLTTRR